MTEEKPLPKSDFAEVSEVLDINHRPHIFVIGSRHFPKDGGMYLQPDQAPCAMPGCNLYYKDHTNDYVACVKLTRNATQDEMRSWLKLLVGEDDSPESWTKTFNPVRAIDGFIFVKTEFDFLPEEETKDA